MDQIIPYCGPAPVPQTLMTAWNIGLLPLALSIAPMVVAAMVPGMRRGPTLVASLALFIAFVSPLCALTTALFSARTLHHVVLVLVAAPALAMAWPRMLPLSRLAGGLGLTLFLWLWHLPAAYTLAWESEGVYWAMQAGLLVSACAIWQPERPGERGAMMAIILALAGQMGLIGAILTFSPRILYPQHLASAPAFGLEALADQQLAGLIMWGPGMLPLLLVGGLLLRRGWREVALT